MEAASSGSSQILYKAWHPNGAWDIGNTEVTFPSEGVATRPIVLPRDSSALTVLYTAYVQGTPAFMERDRNTILQPLTAVDEGAPPLTESMRGYPNPLRAGQRLRLLGGGAAPGGALEVFDLAGRRVAKAEITLDRDGWQAEIPAAETARWSSGIYFARFARGSPHFRIVVLR
jgi:hypothetical protein